MNAQDFDASCRVAFGTNAHETMVRAILLSLGMVLLTGGLALTNAIAADELWVWGIGGIVGVGGVLAAVFFHRNRAARERREAMVADALLQASTLPRGTPWTDFFSFLAKSEWNELGADFRQMNEEVKRGKTPTQALIEWKSRVPGPGVNRAAQLLCAGLESGVDLRRLLRQTAQDLLATHALLAERNAMVWISKATLFLAGAVLVPGILGSVIGATGGLDVNELEELGIGANANDDSLGQSVEGIASAYVIELALLCSVALAWMENRLEKTLLFGLVMIPVAWTVFKLMQTMA